MPAKQKSAKQNRKIQLAAYYAGQKEQEEARRELNSKMMFWKACGHKKCLRAHACAGDTNDCSRRLWPHVPEHVKIGIRALVKAREAGLSKEETKAEIVREITRWQEMKAREAAPPVTTQATAEPAAQSPPILRAAPRAPIPHAPGPRLRVL